MYCDTDSVKVLGKVPIEKLNAEQLKLAERANAYADDKNGKRHYLGLFECDSFYSRFCTHGSKRFAVEELKCLENFKPGMTWKKAGGTMAVYNDNDDFYYTDPDTGKQVHITKNVAIIPTTYKLTYAKDYEQLLGEIQLYGEYQSERE